MLAVIVIYSRLIVMHLKNMSKPHYYKLLVTASNASLKMN